MTERIKPELEAGLLQNSRLGRSHLGHLPLDALEAGVAAENLPYFNRRNAYRVRPRAGMLISAWMEVGSEQVEGWLVDISVEGLRIASKSVGVRHVPERQKVRVRLALPECKNTVEVAGQIITVMWYGKVTHFGIHFDAARSIGKGDVDQRIVDYVMQCQREFLQLLWEKK